MSNEYAVCVGIGVLVLWQGNVLLGERKGSHGRGQFATPGGHLEYLESFEHCARREVYEETNLTLKNIRFLRVCNLLTYAPKHYVDIGFLAESEVATPVVKEPQKVVSWEWYELDKLLTPLFAGTEFLLDSYRSGRSYWDAAGEVRY